MTGVVPPIENYRGQIEAALAYSDDSHSFDDIVRGVENGDMQYWPGAHSVIITEICVVPRYKYMNIFLAGGILTEIEQMAPGIEEWGRRQGCDRMILTGRKGWERTFLKREGWKKKLVVCEKKFDVGK